MDEKYVSYSFYISAFSHCSKIFVQKSDFSIYNSREKKVVWMSSSLKWKKKIFEIVKFEAKQ